MLFCKGAKLKGKENPYDSIKEALAMGVMLGMNLLEGINQDEPGVIAWCENEETAYVETSCSMKNLTTEFLGDFFADPFLDFKLN